MTTRSHTRGARGVALLAVLFALVLLMLLALPFAVSMGVGADAAMRDVEQASVEQASASVRELLLADAALSHPAIDPSPTWDGLDEWPAVVELPPAFEVLRDGGRVLLGGGVVDLQRFLGLDSASPLLFANALGSATRLREDLLPEAATVALEDASALPPAGVVWVGGEVIRYGSRQGSDLLDLERGLYRDQGFEDGKQPIAAGALLLDYRCVLAAAWPFVGSGDLTRRTRQPWRSVGDLLAIAAGGAGAFTADELDTLQRLFTVETMAPTAATWGRPERVFRDLKAAESKTLEVKSALHLGAGSTVRLRNLRTGAVEYNLVMLAASPQTTGIDLPSMFALGLLLPVLQDFPAIDTVVEPLVPAPVNVNTASVEVLATVLAEVRVATSLRVPEADGRRAAQPRYVRVAEARELAEQIVTLRAGGGGEPRPFTGWQDLAERVLRPRFEAATNNQERACWLNLYRNLQTGRDSRVEMGTAPVCFDSGPWVGYRAAASRARSIVAAGVVGRHERTGTAAAVPGFRLERRWATQDVFEEAFQLDRRAPFWATLPVNLGALQPGELGNDPAPRYFPHLAAYAYPDVGFGPPRFPATGDADAAFQPAPATTPPRPWDRTTGQAPRAFDSLAAALDLRGHDVGKEGAYALRNTGPSGAGTPPAPSARSARGTRRIEFPFSTNEGYCGRWAASFWLEPQSLANVVLFEHGDGDPDRNRVALLGRDGNLVFEVLDEAGLDPDPGASPAGVPRTASEWTLPLAELGLPANTPVHVAMSAYAGRPADLSLAVDGMTRGKARHVTWLAAAVPAFDPALANNLVTNAQPPGSPGNERWLDLQVESTDGFPSQGVLRVGLELFEYTSIQGNSFRCRWLGSTGGRGARQVGREHRPSIPLDQNGEPTVDINDPQFQGVNLDVFPEHPPGAMVELYGYAALLSEDSPMMVGTTSLDGAIGGFAVARAFLQNPRQIVIQMPQGPSFQIGRGIDETWTGDLELADPVPTGRDYPPKTAQAAIADAFPAGGGYALLVQRWLRWDRSLGTTSGTTQIGGVELIRYAARQGSKLNGVQRAQQLPGQDGQIASEQYDGTARRFVTDFEDYPWDPANPQVLWDDIPTLITWVVPVSLTVQNGGVLWDPQQTGLSEWVQIYPQGGNADDTEWVRYDALAQGRFLVRANRAAWDAVRFALTNTNSRDTVQVGPLGPSSTPSGAATPPWGTVLPTSGYIGYTPRLESDFPQVRAARYALRFRGDPMQDFFGPETARGGASPQATSSHAHSNAVVMQCHRLQLTWGNHGAYTGRVGRHDRVALVQGSASGGGRRPAVEWHTVNWSARRFDADNLQPNQTPPERLGPWPFQLVAFADGVRGAFVGPAAGTVVDDPRRFDRVVKFPSGELPAAWCEAPTIGAGIGNVQPMAGFVDEVDVVAQVVDDLLLDDAIDATAASFRVQRNLTPTPAGPLWSQSDRSAAFPAGGGLLLIDGEIVAYRAHADGVFAVATNGRGLLHTEARGHDRGARVRFLTHRPAAILQSGVGARDAELPLQARGPLPASGTVLLGRELLHYAWVRLRGDEAALSMPRWFPPGEDPTSSSARGLFRGRYGTAAQAGATGEPLIGFPFRYWDRHVERSDDPELAYFQLTTNEAPVLFRSVRWRAETADPRVEVLCLARTDGQSPWDAEPGVAPGLWLLRGGTERTAGHRLGRHGTRLELRFATAYRPGCVDLASFTAHGWKTTARVEDVRLEFEGQGRIHEERVTAR